MENESLLPWMVGVLPPIAWLAFIYTRDRYEREPKSLVAKLFLMGAIPVVFVASIINGAAGAVVPFWLTTIAVAPIAEELLKYAGLVVIVRKHPSINEPVDGMVLGTSVGLGFAAVENVSYFIPAYVDGVLPWGTQICPVGGVECLLTIAPSRVFYTAMMHGIVSGIAGYGFARARLLGERRAVAQGLVLAIALHVVWNLLAGLTSLNPLVIGVLGLTYIQRFRQALAASPFRQGALVRSGHAPVLTPAMATMPDPTGVATVVPAGGLTAWTGPGPDATVAANLAPGVALWVFERQTARVHVVATNGWTGWIDASAVDP